MASLDLLMVNSEIKNNKMPKAQKIRKRKIVINNIKPLDIKVSYIGELKNKFGIFSQNITNNTVNRCSSLENKNTQTDLFPLKNNYLKSFQKPQKLKTLEIFSDFNELEIKKENPPFIRPISNKEKRINLFSPYAKNLRNHLKISKNNSKNKMANNGIEDKMFYLTNRLSNQREKNIEGLLRIKKVSDNDLGKMNIFHKKKQFKKMKKVKPSIYKTIVTDGILTNDLDIINKKIYLKSYHKNITFKPYKNLFNFIKNQNNNEYIFEESQTEFIKSKNLTKQ
jgi:hypothetical protein